MRCVVLCCGRRRLVMELVHDYTDMDAVVESVDQKDTGNALWKRVRIVYFGDDTTKAAMRAKAGITSSPTAIRLVTRLLLVPVCGCRKQRTVGWCEKRRCLML